MFKILLVQDLLPVPGPNHSNIMLLWHFIVSLDTWMFTKLKTSDEDLGKLWYFKDQSHVHQNMNHDCVNWGSSWPQYDLCKVPRDCLMCNFPTRGIVPVAGKPRSYHFIPVLIDMPWCRMSRRYQIYQKGMAYQHQTLTQFTSSFYPGFC